MSSHAICTRSHTPKKEEGECVISTRPISWRALRRLLRTRIKTSPSLFSSPLRSKKGIAACLFVLSGLQHLKFSMVIRQPLSGAGERARRSPKHPLCYFSPRYKTTGLLQRIPDDLIWQCGGAATRSSSDGNRPELSDYCRFQGESAQAATNATLMFLSCKRTVLLSFTSCKTWTLFSKITLCRWV